MGRDGGYRWMTLQRKPEHSLQAWLHKFLESIVLEPREIRGIDKAGAARNVRAWSAAVARGVKDGTPDVLCVQGDPVRLLWVECKRPDGKGRPSDAQIATANSYEACGVPIVRECVSIHQALDGLRAAGIRVSANADTVAAVYQAHVDASERQRAAAAPVKRANKPRASRVSAAQIKRGHKVGLWRA